MRIWLAIAAVNGALAVAAGAFAAHGLEGRLVASSFDVFETGARYQMYHALAIGLAALVMQGEAARAAQFACWLFLAGIVLFCGSLYALSLSGVATFGFITPVGGVAFLAGWIALIIAGLRFKTSG